MRTISKLNDNMGGILKLWAIPAANVTSLYNGTLTLTGTSDVIEIYCSPGSIVYAPENVSPSKDRAGGYFIHKITGFVPRINEATEEELALMVNRKFVVVLLDSNNQYLAVGTTGSQLRFSYIASFGGDTSERNGYTIVFEGDNKDPYMIISDPF